VRNEYPFAENRILQAWMNARPRAFLMQTGAAWQKLLFGWVVSCPRGNGCHS